MGVFIHNFSLIISGYVHVHKISRQQWKLISNDLRIMNEMYLIDKFRWIK